MNTRLLMAVGLLAGCESIPAGPTVTAMQGEAKSADEFRADEVACRQYASSQVDKGKLDAPAAGSGATGSLIGGTDKAQYAGTGLQQISNRAYVQCLYLRGHKVPLLARERWTGPKAPWPPDPDAYIHPLQR
jgi:hypothetical protein